MVSRKIRVDRASSSARRRKKARSEAGSAFLKAAHRLIGTDIGITMTPSIGSTRKQTANNCCTPRHHIRYQRTAEIKPSQLRGQMGRHHTYIRGTFIVSKKATFIASACACDECVAMLAAMKNTTCQPQSLKALLERMNSKSLSDLATAENPFVGSAELASSIHYLQSAEARRSLQQDPYWPKWNSPWWHIMLLDELGMVEHISGSIVEALVQAIQRHYIKVFLKPSQRPQNDDFGRFVPCHCLVSNMYRVLRNRGIDVDARLPWMRSWLTAYALADGGLNCYESANEKANPKSSIVSTVNVLETILFSFPEPLTDTEIEFLDRGARYLAEHKLCRSVSKGGTVISEDWLKPCFPRFYFYDVLRGLNVIMSWSLYRDAKLPVSAIAESLITISDGISKDSTVKIGREEISQTVTLLPDNWSHTSPASQYPLLLAVSKIGMESPVLTRQWSGVMAALNRLSESNLIDEAH